MIRFAGLAISTAALFLTTTAFAQQAGEPVLKGAAAFGDWRADRPGVRRLIRPNDLPKPYVTKSASNSAGLTERPQEAKPRLPPGFSAELIASGIDNPRVVRVAPNGDLFVADSEANQVRVYRLAEGSAKPAQDGIFAGNLNQPYGIAFYPPGNDPQWVYVANSDSIVRFAYRQGRPEGAQAIRRRSSTNLPASHHWTRDIAFSPDGKTHVSSRSARHRMSPRTWARNRRAGLRPGRRHSRSAPPGAPRTTAPTCWPSIRTARTAASSPPACATASGMTVQPATGALWCVVNERDGLGDNLPPEYARGARRAPSTAGPGTISATTRIRATRASAPTLPARSTVPDVLMQAHSAPLGHRLLRRQGQFPAEYRGDAFVAVHGSWNRGKRTGYKVVRIAVSRTACRPANTRIS